jgi:hypothetical protein
LLCLTLAASAIPRGAAATPRVVDVRAVVDADDDNGDGVADGLATTTLDTTDSVVPFVPVPPGLVFVGVRPDPGVVRLLVDGKPAALGTRIAAGAQMLALQALRPGSIALDLGPVQIALHAIAIVAVDGDGKPVDLASSHASFQRTPPDRVDDPNAVTHDPDALRFVFAAAPGDLPDHARMVSRAEDGRLVDTLDPVPLAEGPCPVSVPAGLRCRTTWPIRVVADDIDKRHPLVTTRSIRAELGGGLTIGTPDGLSQQIRVGGPRHTALGSIERYRGNLRVTVLRLSTGGTPVIGANDGSAVAAAQEQIAGVNARWAQCGISFGPPSEAQVRIVDPPPPFLIAVGCDLGLPASGGRLRITIDGREITGHIDKGERPWIVAARLEREIESAGFRVVRSSNSRIGPGAFPVVDLLVFRRDGTPADVDTPSHMPPSSDPTMPVCIGRASMSRGLRHFLDVDSIAGTVQERTLLKWVDDHDPSTIDAVMVPAFESGGRIGETFLGDETSSLRNLVIVDRGGIRASHASHTLAHELGHVLLEVPGHPDDYGVDTPSLLMDSDAANPTAFGPLRLTVQECERAIRQSGPGAPVPMLEPWPCRPLPKR